MKYSRVIICLFLLIQICFTSNLFAQEVKKSSEIEVIQGKKYYIHTVQKGETLYAIAKAYEVSMDAIAYENPDVFQGIKPDQKLKIPILATPYEQKEHEVQKGETLYGIAKKYNTTIEEIVQLNPDVSKGIKPGQKLIIPVRSVASADYETPKPVKENVAKSETIKHVVKKGETVYGISKLYNISQEKLYELNPGIKQSGLQIGQELIIQTSTKPAEVTPVKPAEVTPKASKETQIVENEAKVLPTSQEIKEIDCSQSFQSKQSVKIAMLIPLQNDAAILDEEESSTDPNLKLSPKSYLEFYEGFLMAIDTIRKTGLNVELYQYEVKRDSIKINSLLQDNKLQTVDLIVGPFHDHIFEMVASWAESRQIPVLNPVLSSNKALFSHNNVIQLNTTLNSQIEQYARYLSSFDSLHVVLVHTNATEDQQIIGIFKKQYAQSFTDNFASKLPSVKEVNYHQVGLDGLEISLHRGKINVIFVPSQSQVFVINLMTKLNDLTKSYKLLLCYMPTWKKFENNVELEHLFNLNSHAFQPFYTDYNSPDVVNFVRLYRFYYKTEPSRLSFLGYDAGVYFLSLLRKYGKQFYSCINHADVNGLSARFYFERSGKKGGFENKGLFILRYDNTENNMILTNVVADKLQLPLFMPAIEVRKVQKY